MPEYKLFETCGSAAVQGLAQSKKWYSELMKSFFISGVAGSGKSSLVAEFRAHRQEAYDIESDEYGLFTFVRKDTGERFVDYDNTDLAKVNEALWVCDSTKLKDLLGRQKNEIAFYCGVAANNLELIPLFDKSFVLTVDPAVLERRLLSREGTDDFANTQAGRKWVIDMKNSFERQMLAAGMEPIDANRDISKVADSIFKLVDERFD